MAGFFRDIPGKIFKWLSGDNAGERNTGPKNPSESANTQETSGSGASIETQMNVAIVPAIVSDRITGHVLNDYEVYMASSLAMTDDEDAPTSRNIPSTSQAGNQAMQPPIGRKAAKKSRKDRCQYDTLLYARRKPMSCSGCGKKFSYEQHLLAHQNVCGLTGNERRSSRLRMRNSSSRESRDGHFGTE